MFKSLYISTLLESHDNNLEPFDFDFEMEPKSNYSN